MNTLKYKCELKKYRCRCGLTQNELALKIGVRRETILRLEAGRCNPSLHLAVMISRIVQVSIEEIFIFDALDTKLNDE